MAEPTKPTPLRKPCPGCGGGNVRSTIAQAADGRPGPNGKPVKAGTPIHECGDCAAIVTVTKPAAAKKPVAASPSRKKRTTTKRR